MLTDLVRWNPFDELWRFVDEFERRIGGMWSRPGFGGAFWPFDVSGTDDARRVRIALPGIEPENINVEVVGRTVHVRAVEKDGDTEVTRYEEMFSVPDAIDTGRITASFRHGLLELTLPFKEQAKPRRIEITTEDRPRLSSAA